jgi:hypothetical protein
MLCSGRYAVVLVVSTILPPLPCPFITRAASMMKLSVPLRFTSTQLYTGSAPSISFHAADSVPRGATHAFPYDSVSNTPAFAIAMSIPRPCTVVMAAIALTREGQDEISVWM